MPLTNVAVRAAKPADKLYRLSDGKSLFLKVSPSGWKSWEFRFKSGGIVKAYVIGPYPEVGLGAARDERDRLRREMQTSGVDPLTARKKGAAEAELAREQARAEADRLREERARQKEHDRVAKLHAAKEAARQRLSVEALLLLWEQHKLPVWSDRGTPNRQRARSRPIARQSARGRRQPVIEVAPGRRRRDPRARR